MKINFNYKQMAKKSIYKLYKLLQNKLIIVNLMNYMYIYIYPYLNKSISPCKYVPAKFNFENINKNNIKDFREIKIAFICDEMTYRCYSSECKTIFLTPYDWLPKLIEFKPDILFCESAWSGIKEFEDCWRGRIYKNNSLKFDNRKVLFRVIDYCKKSGVKTLFWNKEDPTFFNHKIYDFTDTALHFDYIFTTAKECVEKYKLMGHKNVNVLMFGFSPKLFNPLGSSNKEDTCIFAGSWYSDQPKRCEDMNALLSLIKKENMNFKIYDRYYNSSNPVNRFPENYRQYVNKAIDFTELNTEMKKVRYAVNINTVTTSETMFARRVFETMACNTCIISNYSVGMEKMFGDNVWFLNKEFDKSLIDKKCQENLNIIFKNHTYKKRLNEILEAIDISYVDLNNQINIIYLNNDINRCIYHFELLDLKNKYGYIFIDNEIISLTDSTKQNIDSFCNENKAGYFIILNLDNIFNFDIDLALQHFSYIDEEVGIRKGKSIYDYTTDNFNINTIFSSKMLKLILHDMNTEIRKYII